MKVGDKYDQVTHKIGLFFYFYFEGDIKKASDFILRLGVQNIEVYTDKAVVIKVVIHLSRPGLLIGKKGETLNKLEEYIGSKIQIKESESITDKILLGLPLGNCY